MHRVMDTRGSHPASALQLDGPIDGPEMDEHLSELSDDNIDLIGWV